MESEICRLDDAVRGMLREDLPAQLAAFRKALAADDVLRAVAEVHAIHGSAAFCRLESLRQAAASLEQSLKNNNMNAELIRAFEHQVNAVIGQL